QAVLGRQPAPVWAVGAISCENLTGLLKRLAHGRTGAPRGKASFRLLSAELHDAGAATFLQAWSMQWDSSVDPRHDRKRIAELQSLAVVRLETERGRDVYCHLER